MLKTFSGRLVVLGAIGLTLYLQSLLWLGEGGFRDRQQLQARVDEVKTQNLQLMERNRILRAEVSDLKNGMEAVEEHARLDLGLIKPNETFFQMSTLPRLGPDISKASNGIPRPTADAEPMAMIPSSHTPVP